MEEKLAGALKEAFGKVDHALAETVAKGVGFEKVVWFGAEAVEYSSFIFSLTFQLEDFDPPVLTPKGKSVVELLRESQLILGDLLKTQLPKNPRESYTKLRRAVTYMWTAHHETRKKSKLSG